MAYRPHGFQLLKHKHGKHDMNEDRRRVLDMLSEGKVSLAATVGLRFRFRHGMSLNEMTLWSD